TSFKDRLVQHDIAVKLARQDDGGCTYQHKNLDDGGHFQLASISKDRTQSGNGTKCNDKDHGDKEDANRDFGGFRNRFFVGFIQFVVLDQAGFDALKIFGVFVQFLAAAQDRNASGERTQKGSGNADDQQGKQIDIAVTGHQAQNAGGSC